MSAKDLSIIVHEIALDGLPSKQLCKEGRVAFIYDGALASGFPREHLRSYVRQREGWHADDTLTGHNTHCDESFIFVGIFDRVTHWVEFPCPVWQMEAE